MTPKFVDANFKRDACPRGRLVKKESPRLASQWLVRAIASVCLHFCGNFKSFSELIEDDIYDYVTLDASVNARRATGGTAREAVQREITRARDERK